MIRLAIVTDSLSRNAGGLFNSVRRLCQEMQTINCDVSAFGVADSATAEDLREWPPVQAKALPLVGPRFFGYAPALTAAIRSARPDTMQLHGLWKYATIAAYRLANAQRIPYIVHPHGMLDPWAVRNSLWKKRLADWFYQRRILERAACIRALNRSEADAVRAYGLRNPICVIPNAIDVPCEAADPRTARSPFPANRKVLLYLGRIHPKKGLLNLLEAWALVQRAGVSSPLSPLTSHLSPNPWLLAIAGWDQGGYEAKLRLRATELDLDSNVVFLGPRFNEENAACYRHCDAFVLPSLSEGLPMVVLEAWAYAKPVLMTPECNLPDGFRRAAAIRMEKDVECVADGLRKLFHMDLAERKVMGERGLALVEEHYTWPRVAERMRCVQEWVLGRHSAPDCVEFA